MQSMKSSGTPTKSTRWSPYTVPKPPLKDRLQGPKKPLAQHLGLPPSTPPLPFSPGAVTVAGLGSPIAPKQRTPSPSIPAAAPRHATVPTTTPTPIAPPTAAKHPNMKEPKIWASFQRPNYPMEETLLLHILTLMKPGKAANWAQPIMEKIVSQDLAAPTMFQALTDLFFAAFSDPNASHAAMQQLHNLMQTFEANTYTTEFNNLVLDLKWSNKVALKAQYKQGLSFQVKSQLIQRNPYPQTLAALQEAAIKIDGLY
ncbi:hypothetical protein RSOLAG22IIIB_09511 [Rhizoctonia solani]|uniref:Retrotransposon gag domain-containing protein n=1 Tax=Rhizoctonia solani TaxID=456999 RepID=A0A0K6FYY3_9AGAM|nr:hypothetical protein RSOLAG22IIIB_09511 [Rhizoctonia solani]